MKNTKIHIEKASYGVIVGTSNPFLPEAALDPIQNNLYILPYNSTGTHWILSILGQLSFEHDVSGNNNDSESHFGCMFINPGREIIPLPLLLLFTVTVVSPPAIKHAGFFIGRFDFITSFIKLEKTIPTSRKTLLISYP